MKKNWIWLVLIIVVVLILGYVGRHKIKSMLGMSAAPAAQTQTTSTEPSSSTSAMAPSDNIYLSKTSPTKGSYLSDFQGMTLYTYDKDTSGVSNCNAGCSTIWTPYTSGAVAQGTFPTNITVITRSDGSKQFAWKGMPLYYYSKDLKAGDINGDGTGGVWHIVKP